MLVLSRKSGQRIVINGNIEVVVAGIHGSKVRLAIKAPNEVKIVREELDRGSIQKNPPADAFHEAEPLVAEDLPHTYSPASLQLGSSHTT